MFTKTQAHKIKNCDMKMAKKKRERNVERLKNNTKRSKKKRSKTTFALLKQRHKTKTKTDTRNGCKVYSSKAKEKLAWVQAKRWRVAGALQQPPQVEGNRIAAECKVRQKLTRNFLFFPLANPPLCQTICYPPPRSTSPPFKCAQNYKNFFELDPTSNSSICAVSNKTKWSSTI